MDRKAECFEDSAASSWASARKAVKAAAHSRSRTVSKNVSEAPATDAIMCMVAWRWNFLQPLCFDMEAPKTLEASLATRASPSSRAKAAKANCKSSRSPRFAHRSIVATVRARCCALVEASSSSHSRRCCAARSESLASSTMDLHIAKASARSNDCSHVHCNASICLTLSDCSIFHFKISWLARSSRSSNSVWARRSAWASRVWQDHAPKTLPQSSSSPITAKERQTWKEFRLTSSRRRANSALLDEISFLTSVEDRQIRSNLAISSWALIRHSSSCAPMSAAWLPNWTAHSRVMYFMMPERSASSKVCATSSQQPASRAARMRAMVETKACSCEKRNSNSAPLWLGILLTRASICEAWSILARAFCSRALNSTPNFCMSRMAADNACNLSQRRARVW
mmetsp:Transcript_125564/g.361005  ORF Transcript_125564/g.361005 Transcript_125564/m.361005 type:complete len:398 (+) Transcript_125564:281-1474(+)